ncbi:DUF4251 domain-containing protein [Winogradskyella sp.]|uniref:DUF4251 domain-containing protein n=1 Tax=Winogradskyella sp. TaxID=1883156 RepID=UPI00261EF740|nr:DUF4251 domain-containing protein [Winogradskyella sp.]
MITRFLIGFLALGLLSCGGSKSDRVPASKVESYDQLSTLIESGAYQFNPEILYPQETQDVANAANALLGYFANDGAYVTVKPGYFLKIENDSAIAKLPYIGEMTRGNSYGKIDNTGIEFNSLIKDYIVRVNKRAEIVIKFETKGLLESYDVILKLFPNHTSDLMINSSNRSMVRYQGKIVSVTD